MNTITKVMLSAVVVLLLVFAGVVAYRLVGGVTLDQLASNPAQSLTQALSPAQTLEDALRERTKECSPEMQAAFVEAARRINDSFEDSYFLAMSSARIALTPVVRDMQQLEREMAALETDACAEIVQKDLVAAYGAVTDEIMTFMQDTDASVSVFLLEYDLRDATQQLELYALSPEALTYNLDTAQHSEAIREGESPAPELAYLRDFRALDAHSQCVQVAPIWEQIGQALQATNGQFRLEPIPDLETETAEDANEEVEPCADVAVVANPKLVTVEYQLMGSDTKNAVAESVWATLSGGDSLYIATAKLPYTRTVEMMTGHRAQISGWPTETDSSISCAILVDGKAVAEDVDEDSYANCSVVLE